MHYITGYAISFLVLLGGEFGIQSNPVSPKQIPAPDPIQPLMAANQRLTLPTTVAQLKTALGRSYTDFERENFDKNPGGWGNRYRWQFANGLILTA